MTETDEPTQDEAVAGGDRAGRRLATATLQRLQQVTWGSVLQVVLMVLAASVLVNQIAGLDLEAVSDELATASVGLVALGFLLAQLPRVAQSASTLGAAPRPLRPGPVYALQLAQGYVGLAVPSTAARIAMNVRFFQKQGFSQGSALAIGGLDGVAGFVVEASLLVGLLVFTPQALDFDPDAPSLPEWADILRVLVVVALVVAVATVLRPQRREQAVAWVRRLVEDGVTTLRGVRSPRRLLLLFGGNLGSVLGFSVTLGVFAAALGTTVPFGDLVVIVISVSLLAGVLPVPGGIGVVEGGLTFGLVAAGMPEEAAFAAVLLHRVATFYLPPVWGFVAFRWLQRQDLI